MMKNAWEKLFSVKCGNLMPGLPATGGGSPQEEGKVRGLGPQNCDITVPGAGSPGKVALTPSPSTFSVK